VSAEAWPTEDLATKAVEAAARKVWADRAREGLEQFGAVLLPYDELSPVDRRNLGEAVLPIVWAALTDLPDPRYAAWTEGYVAGSSDGSYESEGSGNIEGLIYPHENPYPSGL